MIKLPPENIYGHTKKLRFIIDNINKHIDLHNKPIAVLDFGCGNGSAVSQFLIRDEINYYGVDIHEASLNYAEKNFSKKNAVFLNYIPSGILFDVIVYADILEHLEAPVSILQHHHSLLKEDGLIIGAVPNGFGPFENEKRIDNWLGISRGISRGFFWAARVKRKLVGSCMSSQKEIIPSNISSQEEIIPYNDESGHVQFFTKKALFLTLQQSGFKIECFRNGAFLGAPLSKLVLLRGERIAKLNSQIADFLPDWAVSTWYFTAKKK
jgi:SAM-dependent methyltransferase